MSNEANRTATSNPAAADTSATDTPTKQTAELPFPQRRSVRSFVLRQGRVTQAQQRALDQLASRMAPGAILHCATDWLEYAEQMLAVLSAEPTLENTVSDYAPRPASRPQTKFESRGLRLGHGVRDLLFRKRAG